MDNKNRDKIIIYEGDDGRSHVEVIFEGETVWLTQAQLIDLFQSSKSNISEHIKNIYAEQELTMESTVRKFRTVQKEGDRNVSRDIEHYNLDLIISLGYRVKSHIATKFRIWATTLLREYIIKGFAINKNRIADNYTQFLKVVDDVKKLLPSGLSVDPKGVVELVSIFADTWLSLGAYDKGVLFKGKLTKKKVFVTAEKMINSLSDLKAELVCKSEASDIFGMEREKGSVEGIVGNVMQSFNGKELYPSMEEKAAHLLYFMVKDHPFVDGNKRNGAFAFVWFLKQANILDVSKLTPSALTALTILVASSDPKEKEKVVALILNLIARK